MAWSRDGRRLFYRSLDRQWFTRLTVVHNWFAELERLSPTRR